MRLTKLTNDAISFLVLLGNSSDTVVPMDALKANGQISAGQIALIGKTLRDENYIGTVRGRSGGAYLLKNPRDIRIADIIRLFETDFALTECMGNGFCKGCSRYGGAAYCQMLTGALVAFFEQMNDMALSDLCHNDNETGNSGNGLTGACSRPEPGGFGPDAGCRRSSMNTQLPLGKNLSVSAGNSPKNRR
jgi:Rrf2 family nitric oxide-sensitive transcriptional repressor